MTLGVHRVNTSDNFNFFFFFEVDDTTNAKDNINDAFLHSLNGKFKRILQILSIILNKIKLFPKNLILNILTCSINACSISNIIFMCLHNKLQLTM